MLAFKLQVFLYLLTSFLSFIFLVLFNTFASIGKYIAAVLNDTIDRLQMGVSAILQSCIGKQQLMAKRTFSCNIYQFMKVFQGYNYGSKLNCDGLKVGVALAKR